MAIKTGNQTFVCNKNVYIKDTACVVGPREKEGPLGMYFDEVHDESFDVDSWEKAEAKFLSTTFEKLLAKSKLTTDDIDCILAGDLMNQCIASSLGLKATNVPYLGIFGACSTFVEGMAIGSLMIDSGAMNNVVCMASSNFCSAEKTFRMPLEQGGQRPPTAQCTVSAAGGAWLSAMPKGPKISSVTIGKMIDYKIKDANNMGAAMAPAAADTIISHLKDIDEEPQYYDAIITGDLGITGSDLLRKIMNMHGYMLEAKGKTGFVHNDCGAMIFDAVKQKTNSGGSGCGCVASVFSSYLYRQILEGKYKRLLLVGTGALMSPISVKQAESITGIAHALAIEAI